MERKSLKPPSCNSQNARSICHGSDPSHVGFQMLLDDDSQNSWQLAVCLEPEVWQQVEPTLGAFGLRITLRSSLPCVGPGPQERPCNLCLEGLLSQCAWQGPIEQTPEGVLLLGYIRH